MSIDRVKGEIVWTCDECDDSYETGTDDFQEAKDAMQSDRWLIVKEDDEWLHFCSIGCRRSHRG